MTRKFCFGDIGCYADGAHGHGHVRAKIQDLLQANDGDAKLIAALNDEPSDDFSEEQDALDWLNEHCTEANVNFELEDGELFLKHYVD